MAVSDLKNDDTKGESSEIEFKAMENINRSSPDIWFDNVPDLKEFTNYYKSSDNRSVWSKDFNAEDVKLLHELAGIKPSYLVLEVKRLHDVGYQLGVEEACEVTKAKLLNIFQRKI